MWRTISVLGLIMTRAVGAPAQEVPETDDPVGCYALELGEWQPALMEGNESYQTPPDTVRLSEEVGEESHFEKGRNLVRPVIDSGRTPSAYWTRGDPDSVRVVWTNGFAGVRLHLTTAEGGVLSGNAEAFTDARRVGGPPQPRTGARLRPIPCAPIPDGSTRAPREAP